MVSLCWIWVVTAPTAPASLGKVKEDVEKDSVMAMSITESRRDMGLPLGKCGLTHTLVKGNLFWRSKASGLEVNMPYRLGGLLLSITLTLSCVTFADIATSWNNAKNRADDQVYENSGTTFYCGCPFESHEDSDGSGDIQACPAYSSPPKQAHRASRIEWEHVVPASLMPARQFDCWTEGGRSKCEKDPLAQVMILDLHNLVPSIGQVNALRSDDRYGELESSENDFGECSIKDTRGVFEPSDDRKGDAARVWLYMVFKHGVEVSEDELRMFIRWHDGDPVSQEERDRDTKVKAVQGNGNPWVQ